MNPACTYREIIQEISAQISLCSDVVDVGLESRLILCRALNHTELKLMEQINNRLNQLMDLDDSLEIIKFIDDAIQKRLHGQPLAYILGSKNFFGRDFIVNQDVLIPRFDSEIIISEAIKLCVNIDEVSIIDICSGSGCLGLSLTAELIAINKNPQLTLVDISLRAMDVAIKNSELLNLTPHIKNKILADIRIEWAKIKGNYNIVISNPPYLKSSEIPGLQKTVQNEPMIALDGGEDGMIFYHHLANKVPAIINEKSFVLFEIDCRYILNVIEIIESSNLKIVKIIQDVAGRDRALVLQLKS